VTVVGLNKGVDRCNAGSGANNEDEEMNPDVLHLQMNRAYQALPPPAS
jgi:hypothetical protein